MTRKNNLSIKNAHKILLADISQDDIDKVIEQIRETKNRPKLLTCKLKILPTPWTTRSSLGISRELSINILFCSQRTKGMVGAKQRFTKGSARENAYLHRSTK